MRLSDFDYDLPAGRIAQIPANPRDSARLLIDRGDAPPTDAHIPDLLGELASGDLLVVNDTRVLPARLRLRRSSGGAAEVLLLEALDPARTRWEALLKPAKRLRPGEVLVDGAGRGVVEVGQRTAAGDTFEVRIVGDTEPVQLLDGIGEMPLPPYITERLADPDRYQTVYADQPGSAAAPTAGLHFTDDLLDRVADRGIAVARVELVVGLDTFRPLDTDDPLHHRMHTERYRVPRSTMESVEETRRRGNRVVAVGTTSVRALESAATRGELSGRTDLFIHRGYDWKVVDVMMTNFHLPRTTLLMMIDAFVGDRWRDLYRHALDNDYRFLSFGDAMLLQRRAGDSSDHAAR